MHCTVSFLQSLSNREVNTHTLPQNGLQGYGLQYGHLLTASVVLNTLSVLQSLSNREVNTHTLPQNGLQGYGLQYGHLLTASVYGRRELCCFEHASVLQSLSNREANTHTGLYTRLCHRMAWRSNTLTFYPWVLFWSHCTFIDAQLNEQQWQYWMNMWSILARALVAVHTTVLLFSTVGNIYVSTPNQLRLHVHVVIVCCKIYM